MKLAILVTALALPTSVLDAQTPPPPRPAPVVIPAPRPYPVITPRPPIFDYQYRYDMDYLRADEIPEAIAAIFEHLATSRPRPVHLEVPVDVLEGDWVRRPCPSTPIASPVRPDPAAVQAAAAAIAAARRPLVLVGGGARGAGAQIRALAELAIPVLTTVNGKGILDESHPAALGAGTRLAAAHQAANDADVLVIVGSEVGDSDLWGGVIVPGCPGQRTVIRIDLDPAQMHKNVRADVPIIGDAALVLKDVLEVLNGKAIGPWSPDQAAGHRDAMATEFSADAGPWAEIQGFLAAALPSDTVVAGDSSQVTYWPFTSANRLLYPTGYATLGYGLPAAIGAKVADPGRSVIALIGDGAAMFSIQELITATELRLALPLIIVDNGGYGEIRKQMFDRGIAPQAVDLHRPDIPALARAIGAHGMEASNAEQLGALAAQALRADRPTVIYHRV